MPRGKPLKFRFDQTSDKCTSCNKYIVTSSKTKVRLHQKVCPNSNIVVDLLKERDLPITTSLRQFVINRGENIIFDTNYKIT